MPYTTFVHARFDGFDKPIMNISIKPQRSLGCVWPEADDAQHSGRYIISVCDFGGLESSIMRRAMISIYLKKKTFEYDKGFGIRIV